MQTRFEFVDRKIKSEMFPGVEEKYGNYRALLENLDLGWYDKPRTASPETLIPYGQTRPWLCGVAAP